MLQVFFWYKVEAARILNLEGIGGMDVISSINNSVKRLPSLQKSLGMIVDLASLSVSCTYHQHQCLFPLTSSSCQSREWAILGGLALHWDKCCSHSVDQFSAVMLFEYYVIVLLFQDLKQELSAKFVILILIISQVCWEFQSIPSSI